MSFALKHIPCPAGNKCTAFHCIFGHDSDKSPTNAPTTTPPVETGASIRGRDAASIDIGIGGIGGSISIRDDADQSGPRKRRKPDFDSTLTQNSTEYDSDLPEPATKDIDGRSGEKPARQSGLETACRPVSPPPLKRPAPSSEDRKRKVPTGTTIKVDPSAEAHPSTASRTKVEAAKPKKAESLNPRLLKSSPASHELRFKLLKMLYAEFFRLNKELSKDSSDDAKKLKLSDQSLIIRALDEEEHVAVQKASVYPNVMKNKVMQYKRMKVADWKKERAEERKKELAKKRPEGVKQEEPTKIITGLTPSQEVKLAKRILTDITKLAEHGYVPAVPSPEDIEKARQGQEASKGWEKCDRCSQRFQVFPGRREEDGALTSGGTCTYHWGKTYIAPKAPGDMTRSPKRYQCCGQDMGDSVGCFTQNQHVFKTTDPKRLASILNFAQTPENPLAPTNRAVAFDCEMAYTVHGMELVRLTATSWPTGEVLLDVLVRPLGEILDLNSRYSGVWPDDLAQAESWTAVNSTTSKSGAESGSEDGELKTSKKKLKIVSSPEVARDLLFSLISPSTPLIGHGLENDLNSVRIVHPTIIDTILLYPHKAGLPFRYGLKMLMDVHLGRKIQQETGPKMLGHDSAEDARAAGDLVRLKVRNLWMDMQREGWKLVDGEFVPPGQSKSNNGGGVGLTEDFIES